MKLEFHPKSKPSRTFTQQIINGLVLGRIYALVALGSG
jgi:hypothetical protein